MRNLVKIIIVFLSVTGLSSQAQTHYESNVSLGIKGGADLSRVFFNPSVHQTFAMGTNFGVTLRYIEEAHFGLIAELNFTQRGWKEDFEETPFNYQRTVNYLSLPVLAHIYFGRRGRFFFNAGPEVGLCLGELTSSNFNPGEINSIEGFPIKNRTNYQLTMPVTQKFDYGISAGLGGEFSINRRNSLYIEGRFYYGLGNLFSAKRTDTFRASNSMSIMASVGYWFRIK